MPKGLDKVGLAFCIIAVGAGIMLLGGGIIRWMVWH